MEGTKAAPPSDFYIFGPLKKALRGYRFQSDAKVQQAVLTWFRQQPEVSATIPAYSVL